MAFIVVGHKRFKLKGDESPKYLRPGTVVPQKIGGADWTPDINEALAILDPDLAKARAARANRDAKDAGDRWVFVVEQV